MGSCCLQTCPETRAEHPARSPQQRNPRATEMSWFSLQRGHPNPVGTLGSHHSPLVPAPGKLGVLSQDLWQGVSWAQIHPCCDSSWHAGGFFLLSPAPVIAVTAAPTSRARAVRAFPTPAMGTSALLLASHPPSGPPSRRGSQGPALSRSAGQQRLLESSTHKTTRKSVAGHLPSSADHQKRHHPCFGRGRRALARGALLRPHPTPVASGCTTLL